MIFFTKKDAEYSDYMRYIIANTLQEYEGEVTLNQIPENKATDEEISKYGIEVYPTINLKHDHSDMVINKTWSMPNKETFSIRPIRELIDKYREEGMVIVDPFARNSDIGTITNDLDPETKAMYHKDATDFLSDLGDNIADMVLYDPPYSARQVSESYKRLGESVNMQTTQSSYWARQKKEIARITKKGGVVITCAWNSGGIGAGLGFEQQEILLVAHGGWHNDTIVTVEKKIKD